MPSKLEARCKPLRISALTVRGIGSYLRGARLDIRPLTILCGANGSGKSTWIDVLNLLKESSDEGILPFQVASSQRHKSLRTHAYLRLFSLSRSNHPGDDDAAWGVLAEYGDPSADRDFGPLGCIGAEVEVSHTMALPSVEGVSKIAADRGDAPAMEFLIGGVCTVGMVIRVRVLDPDISPKNEGYIEIAVRRERADTYIPLMCLEKARVGEHYGCLARAPWPSMAHVADVRFPGKSRKSFEVTPARGEGTADDDRALCLIGIRRIQQILKLAFEGHFYLGAIRKIVSAEDYKESAVEDASADCVVNRYVGRDGADTHKVYYNYCLNSMLQDRPPFGGYLARPGIGEKTDTPHWSYAVANKPDLGAATILRAVGPGTMEGVYGKDLVTRLRGVLSDPKVRALLEDGRFLSSLSAEARFLLAQPPEAIDDLDVERLLFIVAQELMYDGYADKAAYVLETFYGVWMKYLLDIYPVTESIYPAESLAADWNGKDKPRGFLAEFSPAPAISETTVGRSDYARYYHACFNYSSNFATPDLLSAGFHQIAPMVVQCGVMRANEVLCMENPEVHLHPSLQTRLTEFLVNEASSGKCLIVETHSDLVIYRVMRAILEESIPQEAVRIYFTEIEKVGDTAQSVLTPIPIDDRGRIAKWPRGFMDEEIAEFTRLMNARDARMDDDLPE